MNTVGLWHPRVLVVQLAMSVRDVKKCPTWQLFLGVLATNTGLFST